MKRIEFTTTTGDVVNIGVANIVLDMQEKLCWSIVPGASYQVTPDEAARIRRVLNGEDEPTADLQKLLERGVMTEREARGDAVHIDVNPLRTAAMRERCAADLRLRNAAPKLRDAVVGLLRQTGALDGSRDCDTLEERFAREALAEAGDGT